VSEKVSGASVVLGEVCASSLNKTSAVSATLGHDSAIDDNGTLNRVGNVGARWHGEQFIVCQFANFETCSLIQTMIDMTVSSSAVGPLRRSGSGSLRRWGGGCSAGR